MVFVGGFRNPLLKGGERGRLENIVLIFVVPSMFSVC